MMTEEQAQEIVALARHHGIAISGQESISVAEELVSEAQIAWDNGMKGEPVKTILTIAGAAKTKWKNDSKVEIIPGSVRAQGGPHSPPEGDVEVMLPSTLDKAYEARIKAQARIKKEKLPIPEEIDGEPPTMPRDLSNFADRSIRRFSSEFNACLARTNWLLSNTEADELVDKQLAEYHFGRALRELRAEDNDKVIPVLEAEARDNEDYKVWKQREIDHKVEAKLLRSLRDTYQGNCDRLSREFTMRTEERQVTR